MIRDTNHQRFAVSLLDVSKSYGGKVVIADLIPSPSDQHSWAQSRRPIDIIRQG